MKAKETDLSLLISLSISIVLFPVNTSNKYNSPVITDNPTKVEPSVSEKLICKNKNMNASNPTSTKVILMFSTLSRIILKKIKKGVKLL